MWPNRNVLLDCISEQKLKAILEIEKFSELDQDLQKLAQKLYPNPYVMKYKWAKIFIELFGPLSYLFLIPDALFTLTSMPVMPFAVATIVFNALFIMNCVIDIVATYKKLRREEDKTNQQLQLLALKNACLDKLLKKNVKNTFPAELSAKAMADHKWWSRLKDAKDPSIISSVMLFYCYYASMLAFSTILPSASFVAVLLNPIVISAVLAFSLFAGVSMFYAHFQIYNQDQWLTRLTKSCESEVNEKMNDYKNTHKQENRFSPHTLESHWKKKSTGSRPVFAFYAVSHDTNQVIEKNDSPEGELFVRRERRNSL